MTRPTRKKHGMFDPRFPRKDDLSKPNISEAEMLLIIAHNQEVEGLKSGRLVKVVESVNPYREVIEKRKN